MKLDRAKHEQIQSHRILYSALNIWKCQRCGFNNGTQLLHDEGYFSWIMKILITRPPGHLNHQGAVDMGRHGRVFLNNRMTRSWSQMGGFGGEESMDRQKGAAKTRYHKTKLAGSQAVRRV